MAQLMRSTEETVCHRDGIRPPSLCWKAASPAHPVPCAASEAFNAPLFCLPEWSKCFHGWPFRLVWMVNVYSCLVYSSGWTEHQWYFESQKARRERNAVNQYQGTPEETCGDWGSYTAGRIIELHKRVLKITIDCWGFLVYFPHFHKQLLTDKQILLLEPHWKWQRELRICNGHLIFGSVSY